MKLALVQQHATRDKAANVQRGLDAVDRAAALGAQVICFAELAFEWFHPQRPAGSDMRSLSETLEGPLVAAFQAKAKEHGVVLVLNFFERDGLETYDCSPVVDANGIVLGMTRMVHITEYACFHEQGYYTPGDTGVPVYDTKFGRIGVAICYDRHFPEYMRGLALAGADLVVVPQAGTVGEWPDGLYESRDAGGGVPERLSRGALQPRGLRRVRGVRRRVVRVRPLRRDDRAGAEARRSSARDRRRSVGQ